MTSNEKFDSATGAVSEAELVELADSMVAGGTTWICTVTVPVTIATISVDACPTSACTKSC